MAELRPVAAADETEAELAVVLDSLWRKLHGIHEQEVTRTAARLRQASNHFSRAVVRNPRERAPPAIEPMAYTWPPLCFVQE